MSVEKVNETTPQSGCSTVWNVLHLAAQNLPTEGERGDVRYDAEAHRDALLSGIEILGTLLSDSALHHQYDQHEMTTIGEFMRSAANLINGMNTLIDGCDRGNGK
ncbi:hypothetical protein [Citrobacter portucalensis]|uniref:hypothetical protein n=1 Tax=Citrobacter portucalensis TaxID=1639133 RepID=UPI00224361EE|nr:hypothetical protein [Citrobacter portucalensis]MCW8351233.1 hypothetical protein [Citrobacter portucalensis]MCX9049725.1 hypothetical protein [Citrobacter portucalensis]